MERGLGTRWLLLLSRPPLVASVHSLRVAYGPALTQALQEGSETTKQTSRVLILDIGVAYDAPKTFDYSRLQNIFGLLYKLVCIICTEHAIDLLYENEVDVRVFIFQNRNDTDTSIPTHDYIQSSHVIDLQQVAQSKRPWSRICSIESEEGEGLLRAFLRFGAAVKDPTSANPQVSRLPGGLILNIQHPSFPQADKSVNGSNPQHRSVAVGGTFDHLHAGHKLLLSMTALLIQATTSQEDDREPCLTIGITGDKLLKDKKFKEFVEDWDQRQESVKAFLLDFLPLILPSHVLKHSRKTLSSVSEGREVVDILQSQLKIRYTEIFDPFGPTITDPAITALVISAETKAGGDAVNKKRHEKEWPTLEIFEVDVLDTDEGTTDRKSEGTPDAFQNKLSSTEIRSRLQKKGTPAQLKLVEDF